MDFFNKRLIIPIYKRVPAPREVCPLVDHRGWWQYNINVDSIGTWYTTYILFLNCFQGGGPKPRQRFVR